MLRKLLIPSAQNKYKPFFSSKSALVVFTLWLLIFNSVSSILISSHGVHANALSTNRIVELTNEERHKRGLDSLEVHPLLTSAAYSKANNMFQEQYWDHFGPNDETPWQFINAAGYEYMYAGENLGKGFNTSEGLHQAWMASTTHRENITNQNYTHIGIAVVHGTLLGQNIELVVQLFGSPADDSLVLGDADYETSESRDGNLKSIRIIYPEEGEVYNDPSIPVKGEVDDAYRESLIQIIRENSILGEVDVSEDNIWEFRKPYDWEQGENVLDAMILDEGEYQMDSVSFIIDSIPPSVQRIDVENLGDSSYRVQLKIDKVPANLSAISGGNMYQFEVEENRFNFTVNKEGALDKVFLILSDSNGNIREVEITEYFPASDVERNIPIGAFVTAFDAQRLITISFALFIFAILSIQFYYYRKLGMLKQKEGDFLILGLWWFILLFGSFIGYAGTVS